jgi:hypothetical protein
MSTLGNLQFCMESGLIGSSHCPQILLPLWLFRQDSKLLWLRWVSHLGERVKCYFLAQFLFQVIKTKRPRTSRWVSSSIPQDQWDTDLARYSSSDYYVNNLVSPVLFQEALHLIPRNAVTVEIAPHCLLQAILKRSLGTSCVFTGLMKRGHQNNLEFLLSNIGK